MSAVLQTYGRADVAFERGEGAYLYATDGRRYLDFTSGIAVTSLGHCHPHLVEAIQKQAATLMHTSNLFVIPGQERMAERLAQATFADLVFFGNSGAEANEAAIKLARKFGGRSRHRVVSMLGSFHGRTLAALAATGQPAKHEPFQPMPEGFSHVPYGDLGALERTVDGTVAAVLLECVQGEGGVLVADDDYLRGVRQLCTERGALLIVDEVQTGFARTGSWFAFEHSGIAPDAVTLAKAMGNGVPVGALWARRDVGSVFVPGDHGSTYSGTALATAAVIAVIEAMRDIDAPRRAREMGAMLAGELRRIPQVVDVRGRGLLLAVELGASRDAKAIVAELLERGLVANAVTASAIRLAPPLTVSRGEIDEAVAMIAGVLQ